MNQYYQYHVPLQKFGIGDRVRVDSDKMKTIRLQKGHGEWIAEMKKVILVFTNKFS